MIDFLMISTRSVKKDIIEIYPKFIIKKSSDLMIRGGDFYAIWLEEKGMWSTDEQDALSLIDLELDKYAAEKRNDFDGVVKVLHMWDAESGMIDRWHKYCQKQMRDSFHTLDDRLIFSNMDTGKTDYASKKLNYPLEEGLMPSYEKLISTLYSPEERQKIEWAIGAIVTGESKTIQKFLVLYGAAGTGKSTILNIIQQLFDGYYSVFDAKALGSTNNAFALEAFKTNPLVAIQHDGDLSRIEDNTRLNSVVSHELMTVNEKFKSTYANRFKCFLLMGTNKPVKITDAKSGLIRRLIDVSPSGNKLPQKEYERLMGLIPFELGAIAYHCKNVYIENRNFYNDYIPTAMMGASNDFYNFIIDSYYIFKKDDGTSLKAAWEMYKNYCENANVTYPYSQRIFKEELKNYFRDYKDRFNLEDGSRARSYYSGFRTEKFEEETTVKKEKQTGWLELKEQKSILDKEFSDCPAQYASAEETPKFKWDDVTTVLSNFDTGKLHYVKLPIWHIVIDFDIPDENGKKSLKLNVEAANKYPPTYAEVSKGGGLHLHYIYSGDPTQLSSKIEDHIEIKVFTGKSSLRRKLTKCNDVPIATISSGLPLKGEKAVISFEGIKSEKSLRTMIERNLAKEIHPATKPSVDFIYKILNDAYESGMNYDVSDMIPAILAFASGSSHQADKCIKLVNQMPFCSDDISNSYDNDEAPIAFYDVEVFPNLFLVNWKLKGEDNPVVRLINPSKDEIEELLRFRLIGFNCRRYDNHMLYARMLGYSEEEIYCLSQRIIGGDRNAFFGNAYNISYTDVYDFSSKKQSLKKFEIELGIHHQELGLPWDQPVPREKWELVAEYCDNDVIATEAVFNARQSDFIAREILADVAGLSVNDTTNTLTTRIIFGGNRNPQTQFNYRNMGEELNESETYSYMEGTDKNFTIFKGGKPIFPGYKYEMGKSTYRGEEVGEGGYVYSEPGMYGNVALLDIASMHPSSIVAEELFGPEYTSRFKEILDARIAIKHKDFEKAKTMLNGALAKYLKDENAAKDLASALKIAINSVYGLTSAGFSNPFRDTRNVDNIVAKRGALFMVNLKHEVQARGFTVAHIKTDSIKIPDATPEIIDFVTEYGKMYGYNFEHEATYDRMCLVNKAVYISKENGRWSATGDQFAIPYVFKTLFSNEPVVFDDFCEAMSVKEGNLYLDMNEALPDVTDYEQIKKVRESVKAGKRLTKNANEIFESTSNLTEEELDAAIAEGHDYKFVGRVGNFCPVKEGTGGGILYRVKDGKYYAAAGTKGYRWREAEDMRTRGIEDDVDLSYFQKLADDAIETISKYGDFEWFVSDDPYISSFKKEA